jgi:cardiolipin synthase A/B
MAQRARAEAPKIVVGPAPYRPERSLAEQAFSRAAGAPLVAGNRVRLLKDAAENYPAWLEAIAGAKRFVHFECYIIHDDETGRHFADALAAKAGEGVPVRLIYDWLGGLGTASRRFWRRLREAGVDVRTYNPPRLDSPFGWVSRDHRKMLGVDGAVSFVTGLCVGRMWTGDPERGIPPWRDTGVEVRGPAIVDVEQAFADVWAGLGDPLPAAELPMAGSIPAAGDVALRVVASTPNTAGLYRLDQLIAAVARKTLWLTDAYFVGVAPYVQALGAAARDGVDVRLLVPNAGDVAVLRPLSRAGYRSLLEAGVRVFEWNGSMLHAKTAVADSRWARVGSTNLNVASWLGNCELDVAVEDETFAREMEAAYTKDLEGSTEVVLSRRRVRRSSPTHAPRGLGHGAGGSAGRAAAGALRIGRAVGAALTNRRLLGAAEAQVMAIAGVAVLAVAVVAALWPPVVAYPLAAITGWLAIGLFTRARTLWQKGRGAPSKSVAGG